MKFFFSVYALLCLPALGFSQNWQTLPGEIGDESIYAIYHDTVTQQIYVGGDFYVIDGDSTMRSIASWDGSEWHSLTYATVLIYMVSTRR